MGTACMIWTVMCGNGVMISTDLIITRIALLKILRAQQIAMIPTSLVWLNVCSAADHSYAAMSIVSGTGPEAVERVR